VTLKFLFKILLLCPANLLELEFIYCFYQSVKKDYFTSLSDCSLSLSDQMRLLDAISQGERKVAGLEITEINAHAIKTGRGLLW
jgi:hypothetical protein